jgi:hypothetical protein
MTIMDHFTSGLTAFDFAKEEDSNRAENRGEARRRGKKREDPRRGKKKRDVERDAYRDTKTKCSAGRTTNHGT